MNIEQEAGGGAANVPYSAAFIERYKGRRRKSALYFMGCLLVGAVSFALIRLVSDHPISHLFYGLLGGAAGLGIFLLVGLVHNQRRVWMLKTSRRPEHLYEAGVGLAFSENKDMEMCEQMSAEGYALVKVTNLGLYKFARTGPEALRYSVDFSDLKPKAEGFKEYIDIFESGGWQYVCSNDIFHWFRAPKGTTPIYTDSANLAQKHQRMRRICVWWTLSGALAAAVFFTLNGVFPDLPNTARILFAALGGAGGGIGATMGFGILLNHSRILQLKRSQGSL